MEERQNDLTFLKRGISDIDLSESHESRQNQSSLNRNDSTDSADYPFESTTHSLST